jgi:hypothetical protein
MSLEWRGRGLDRPAPIRLPAGGQIWSRRTWTPPASPAMTVDCRSFHPTAVTAWSACQEASGWPWARSHTISVLSLLVGGLLVMTVGALRARSPGRTCGPTRQVIEVVPIPLLVGHGCRVVDGSAAGCPAWPLPQCPHALRRSRVSAVPGRAGSRYPDSRSPLAASTWPLDQRRRENPICTVLPSRRNGGCRSTAVLPQPDTTAGVWAAAEPDTADALAVHCCSPNRGRYPEGRCLDDWCPDG